MKALASSTYLIAACCRRSDDLEKPIAISKHNVSDGDWNMLLDMVARHRVNTQVYAALQNEVSVPPSVLQVLARRSRECRMRGLLQLSDLVRVTALLRDAQIRVAEIKGMTLGILAYGSTNVKESIDIDLLVRPSVGRAAIKLLIENGYKYYPDTDLTDKQIDSFIQNRKDISLIGVSGVKIELHWRLTHGSGLLCGAGENEELQLVQVAFGHQVSTLATPDLVAYLAVHGSLHNWSRIKWLADFDAIFRASTDSQRQIWLDYARTLGAERCMRYALAMSYYVIGPFPDDLSNAAAMDFVSNRGNRKIVEYGLRCLEDPYPPSRKTIALKVAFLVNNFFVQALLFRRITDARSLLRHYLFVEKDIVRFPLPRWLRYLYPFLRCIIWAIDQVRIGGGQSKSISS